MSGGRDGNATRLRHSSGKRWMGKMKVCVTCCGTTVGYQSNKMEKSGDDDDVDVDALADGQYGTLTKRAPVCFAHDKKGGGGRG